MVLVELYLITHVSRDGRGDNSAKPKSPWECLLMRTVNHPGQNGAVAIRGRIRSCKTEGIKPNLTAIKHVRPTAREGKGGLTESVERLYVEGVTDLSVRPICVGRGTMRELSVNDMKLAWEDVKKGGTVGGTKSENSRKGLT